ncbi:MAG: flagellar biosynthesis regulator FlaF [Pseudomonadota bacterium]
MQSLANLAYGEIQQRTASDRELEHALFQQITDALEALTKPVEVSASARADAVSRNLQMWNILASDVALPTNALMQETKDSLLYLSAFVRQMSFAVFEGDEDKLAELIEVNKAVMSGLLAPSDAQISVGE